MGALRTFARKMTTGTPSLQALRARIPPGTWDTHMHVVDPEKWPLAKAALYTPPKHTLEDAHAILGKHFGIKKMVIVQPSIYGNDNGCTLEGLQGLGTANGRAVIQFDPRPSITSRAQLEQWHALGVRGVRLNFKSLGAKATSEELQSSIGEYVTALHGLNWVIQIYIAMEDIPLLEPVVTRLDDDVKICIDHMGHPSAEALEKARSATDLSGYSALVNMLKQGRTWVKLSATYRIHKDPQSPIVESLCRGLVRARPDRCVFATDWPHTRYDGVEVGPYLTAVLDWIEAENGSTQQVCVKNAETLFDAKSV